MPDRNATTTWQGDLLAGSGVVTLDSSNAGQFPVSFPARAEEPNGLTSPEELIAAAHASCFSMALSGGLAKEGHAPEELKTSATVTFQPGEGITKIALDVTGRVPGMDEAAFKQAAEQARENCPVSKALAGVPEISITSRLQG